MTARTPGGLAARLAATMGALAIGLLGTLAIATPAHADVPPNIDTTKNGSSSIVVHKFTAPGTGTAGNGTEITDTSGLGTPLNGVAFDIYRLTGIDLTTNAGWATAKTISTAINGGATVTFNATGAGSPSVTINSVTYPVTAAGSQTTAGSGTATFGSLGFGIYVVVEGADSGNNNITAKAQPFVVSLPFATGTNNWLYTVHAYPKNSVTAVSKALTSASTVIGGVVTWTVSAKIPDGANLTSFSVSDTFDSRLTSLGVASVKVGTTVLGTGDYAVTGTGQTKIVTPTLSIINANKGKTVEVVFTSTASSMGTDGIIPNTAVVNINNTNFTTAPVNVTYGGLKVLKYAAGDTTKTLAGASFALYATEAEANAALAGTVGTPLWTGTTPANGVLTTGLRPGTYYLVETAPPAGYTASGSVFSATITAGTVGTAYPVTSVNVPNTQVPPWALPLTGGSGTTLFTVGGAVLLFGALVAGVVVSRRNRAKA